MSRAVAWYSSGSVASLHRRAYALQHGSGAHASRSNRHRVTRSLVALHESLLGRRTLALAQDLDRSQWLPECELQELQWKKLRAIIAHAAAHCPYYGTNANNPCNSTRILPAADSIRTIDDLPRVPLLSRAMLRQFAPAMRSTATSTRILTDHTHGTSDEPFAFYCDRARQAWDKAHRLRGHAWHGFDVGDRELHFWPVDPPGSFPARVKQWMRNRRDALTAELLIDSLRAFHGPLAACRKHWRNFDPLRVTAYPSSLVRLIRASARENCRIESPSLQRVFLTGEVTFAWQRRIIEEFLGAPVTESYGLQEAGALAYCCEEGNWHLCAESAFIEIIRDGRPARPGELGEVVVTGLESHAMPLIRYCTGDIACAVELVSCKCGRGLPVIPPILGRVADFLEAADGRWIAPAAVVATLGEVMDDGTYQLRQSATGDVTAYVVASEQYRRGWAPLVKELLSRLVGRGVPIEVRSVSTLRYSAFGKCRYVDSDRTREGLAQPQSTG